MRFMMAIHRWLIPSSISIWPSLQMKSKTPRRDISTLKIVFCSTLFRREPMKKVNR
jgi:hypothetical protein